MKGFRIINRLLLLLASLTISINAFRMVGYWSLANGYENQTGCAPVLTPDKIPAELYTHIIYSFMFIGPGHQILEPTEEQLKWFNEIQEMRTRNPKIILLISLGGWSMDMSLYSNAVATPDSRSALIQSCLVFLRKYNWDGIDFDWEYPSDPLRGGKPADRVNFATFISEMRAAVESESVLSGKTKIELSIALPGGPYHGQHYDMVSMIQHLDFANIMAYNLHGPWENQVYCSANFYDGTPEGSLYHGYSIHDAVQYYLHQDGSNLPGDKFNLGVTFAGVAFKLADPLNHYTPGSLAIGEGIGGSCTKEAGYMAYFEVETLLINHPVATYFDDVGKCRYFVYEEQWIGYDDPESFEIKVQLVKDEGLGGISIWAMYAESSTGSKLQYAIHSALTQDNAAATSNANMNLVLIISVILTMILLI